MLRAGLTLNLHLLAVSYTCYLAVLMSMGLHIMIICNNKFQKPIGMGMA